MSADPSAWRETKEAKRHGSAGAARYLWICEDCKQARNITIRVGKELICGRCWKKRGQPEITFTALEEAATKEAETRGKVSAHVGRKGAA